jgi:hypothetical protein
VSMRFKTRSGRLPLRSRFDLKLAAAAGPNTPDLHAQTQGGDTGMDLMTLVAYTTAHYVSGPCRCGLLLLLLPMLLLLIIGLQIKLPLDPRSPNPIHLINTHHHPHLAPPAVPVLLLPMLLLLEGPLFRIPPSPAGRAPAACILLGCCCCLAGPADVKVLLVLAWIRRRSGDSVVVDHCSGSSRPC